VRHLFYQGMNQFNYEVYDAIYDSYEINYEYYGLYDAYEEVLVFLWGRPIEIHYP